MPNRVSIVTTVKDGVSRDLEKIRDKFDLLGKGAASSMFVGQVGAMAFSKGLGLVTQAGADVLNFMADSIKSASDLNETMNKSAVVFGSSAAGISQWADTAAKSMGESKQAALEAAATFGNLFESMGIGQSQAADLSMKLVQLASDLASFNNIDPAEALQKLQSGIVGETKAVRDLGIDLSETTVQQELQREGVKKVGAEYTNAQKILARYQLIIQQTGNAQGDFARTSDGLANKQRIAAAEVENLKAKLGTDLIPVQQFGLTVLDDTISALDGVITGFNDYATAAGKAADQHQGFLDVILGGKPTEAERNERTIQFIPMLRQVGDGYGDVASKIPVVMHMQRDFNLGLNDAKYAAKNASEATGEYTSWLWKLAAASDGAAQSTSDLADTIENDLFGKAITAGHEAELKQNIADLIDQRSNAKKNSTEWKALTGEIANDRKELFELHLEMAATKGPQAAIDFLKSIKTNSVQAAADIQKLIDKYSALLRVVPSGTTYGGTGTIVVGKRLASGGVIKPGDHGTVGEDGIEDFEAVGGLVKITPRHKGATPARSGWTPAGSVGNSAFGLAGGNSVVVHVHLPNAYGMTPGQAEQVGRALEPHITRAQQRAGHLAPARAF